MNDIIERDCRDILRLVDIKKAKGKKILITGANGLLGQYLVAVFSYANKNLGFNCKINAGGLHGPKAVLSSLMKGDKNISYKKVDLSKPFKGLAGYHYIFHAAGYAQPAKFVDDPVSTININVNATKSLLDGSPKATFVFFSSAEVYGDIPKEFLPVREDYNGNSPLHNPRSVYAESKRLGEALCASYRRIKGTDIKIARISAVYGPGLPKDDTRVMSDFIKKAITLKEIKLLDSGNSIRTYGYISDITAMILFIAFHSRDMVYNAGGKDSVSILELAKKIAKYCGANFKVPSQVSKLSHIGKGPLVVKSDLSKIKKEMKKLKFTSFNEGLARTIEWSIRNNF
ncbi:hypothetical protein A2774_03305 [Candidatus Roizmanbacteria bacterium RIFCSPHIGHO2_01_FULL_39_12c]|uniref:NAD-dependent epimerase/dehydratase domain-containing protein n=1 Tax=Candidatus Roizmanbacteria bacterium RIFCSPHIGHO2_01_FULL_39_12c TaxID=1802031 RepID=A0A1F7GEA3_9BACT|nr:MAG: hypothetical protein A2774_03305 [Candidatus Roizmanbacteria bacterium RIFCSPHIGHO2_01_FULL_39_12c]